MESFHSIRLFGAKKENMQIINTIEIVCANCGKPVPVPLSSPKRDKVRGVWIVEVMPCHNCAESGVAADAERCVHPQGYIKSIRVCGLCGEQL